MPIQQPAGKHSKFESCCLKLVSDGSFSHRIKACTPRTDAALLAQTRKCVDVRDPAATVLARSYYFGHPRTKQDAHNGQSNCGQEQCILETQMLISDLDISMTVVNAPSETTRRPPDTGSMRQLRAIRHQVLRLNLTNYEIMYHIFSVFKID